MTIMKNAALSGFALTRLAKPFIAALLFVGLLSTASAQPVDGKPKETPVEVKYLGTENGKPLFQISYNNQGGQETVLTLRDEAGFVIYTDVSKERSYSRKLQFSDLDTDRLKLTLTLRSKKETQTQTFEITKNTRTIEDVAVVSL